MAATHRFHKSPLVCIITFCILSFVSYTLADIEACVAACDDFNTTDVSTIYHNLFMNNIFSSHKYYIYILQFP
jgi:hypothetical protein